MLFYLTCYFSSIAATPALFKLLFKDSFQKARIDELTLVRAFFGYSFYIEGYLLVMYSY